MTDQEGEDRSNRRSFLRTLGISSAGVSLAAAARTRKERIKEGGDEAKIEIEKLKQAYEELDRRSKFILRVVLVLSGLDFFI